jgi:hypothetical protein
VFGQRLDETVAYEQKFGPHLVPILVEKCTEFILEHGVNEEGIFRLPGQDNLVKQLRDAFDAGERPSFDRYTVLVSSVLCPPSVPSGSGKDLSIPVELWDSHSCIQEHWLIIEGNFCSTQNSEVGTWSTVRRACGLFM